MHVSFHYFFGSRRTHYTANDGIVIVAVTFLLLEVGVLVARECDLK